MLAVVADDNFGPVPRQGNNRFRRLQRSEAMGNRQMMNIPVSPLVILKEAKQDSTPLMAEQSKGSE
ncbi:MAG TPA: hypothetical protein VFK23_05865 [Nitrospirota bacterium]|nr:hypothetical protein [Nitrospirota bacterium]